jgi:hypothetical protein
MFLFLWVPQLSPASDTNFSQQQLITTESQRTQRVGVRVTLRLAVYRQSVLLAAKPLEVYDQSFFPKGVLFTDARRAWILVSTRRS